MLVAFLFFLRNAQSHSGLDVFAHSASLPSVYSRFISLNLKTHKRLFSLEHASENALQDSPP